MTSSLSKPFAAFGAAAGLFAILAIGSYRSAAREVHPLEPMIVTGAVGWGLGALLQNWKKLHESSRETMIAGLALSTVVAGMVAGGLLGFFVWGPDGALRFALGGGGVGLVFTPSCLVVFEAARRAGRARHGSLVAATDARTVLSTVFAGVAFAAATQVPAILTARMSDALRPGTQVFLSLFCAVVPTIAIVILQRRDKAGMRALEGFERDAPWLDPAGEERVADPAAVDLGMGDQKWTRASDTSYRASGRAEVLVRGSIADAKLAFDECTRRRHHSLIVAASALSAVTVATALRIGVYL